MYDVIKRGVFDEQPGIPLPLYQKMAAGLSAGAVGAALSNPCDLIMVRMLADRHLPADQRRAYRHALEALVRIPRDEGLATYMNGFVPNIARATVVTASQLVTYDQIKQSFLKFTPMEDTVPTHILSSFVAGVVTGLTSNPMDVIKTRMMNAFEGQYQGLGDCILQTARNEGLGGFYKGCSTTIGRQCTYTLCTFVIMEQVKRAFKLINEPSDGGGE